MLSPAECLIAAHALEHWKGGSSSGTLPELSGITGVLESMFTGLDDCELGARIVAANPARAADG